MAKMEHDLDPLWNDLDWYVPRATETPYCWPCVRSVRLRDTVLTGVDRRAIGQMLIMGWDGTEVTPQIRNLIEDHHLGSILLTAKNLKCGPPLFLSPVLCLVTLYPSPFANSLLQLPTRRQDLFRSCRQ